MPHQVKKITLLLVGVLLFSSLTSGAPTTNSSPDPILAKGTNQSPGESIIPTRKLGDQAFFVASGLWAGVITHSLPSNLVVYLRFGKSLYEEFDKASEYTFEVINSGGFGGSVGYKYLQDIGFQNEPFFKVAMGAIYQNSQLPVAFVNWRNYQLRGEIGFDDLFSLSRRLRGELGFSLSGAGGSIYIGGSLAF